jgi:dihydroflavonol-4-reductase
MDALVTGGTGFVGANLVRELLAGGGRVRVLARPGGDRRALEGCSVEVVEGDVLDQASVRAAVRGARRVYHVAADYRLWAPDPRVLYRANVDGTRHVLEAAWAAGAERIVHTSTVGAVGIPKSGAPGDETTPVSLADMVGAYKASKFLAERVAEELAARGAPVVIVNPSAPIGPWDVKPTPTGQMIVDFLKGKMVASLDTGLNLVHVRDVARGHIQAAERGRVGERYILGNENLSLLAIFRRLAELTGIPAPRFRAPYAAAWLAAAAMEVGARVTRRPPAVPLTAVRMARKRMHFSAARAVRELGLPQTPVDVALADAVGWFVAHGYAPRPPRLSAPGSGDPAPIGRSAVGAR